MWIVAIDAEHATMYLALKVDTAIGKDMVELALMRAPLLVKNHISNGRAACVWEILPAGIRKFGQDGVCYAVLAAYVVDRVGSGVWVEFDGIIWASL